MTITDSGNAKRKTQSNNQIMTTPVKQTKPNVELAYEQDEKYKQIQKALAHKVNALKNIHLNIVGLEEKFYEELHQLECKYAKLYEKHFEQRDQIVSGAREPTATEAVWALDENSGKNEDDDVKGLVDDMEAKIGITEAEDFVGVPHFWIQVFKRTDLINDMIQEQDEDVLTYLQNIKVIMKDTKPYGFTLEFHFRENEYFSNKVLYKSYELTCEQDTEAPLQYDGPVMYKCQGCTINWYKGKNVTVHTVKKRQKHKSTGTVRTILKEEKQDSFFNYFDTPTVDGIRPSFRRVLNPEAGLDEDEEEEEIGEDLCNADFEIGHFFKEFIVPKAILYYTGDLIDQASYIEDDGELDDFLPDDKEAENDDEVTDDGDTDDMDGSDATEPKNIESK